MNRFMISPFFINANKHAADQRLCFRYMDRTIVLLPKSKTSSLQPLSVVVQLGLCRTWLETPETGFLATRLDVKQLKCNQTAGTSLAE